MSYHGHRHIIKDSCLYREVRVWENVEINKKKINWRVRRVKGGNVEGEKGVERVVYVRARACVCMCVSSCPRVWIFLVGAEKR